MLCSNNAKRVAFFQASLMVVTKEAGAQLSKRDNNTQHPKDQKVYRKEDAVNKNDTLVLRWQND